MNTITLTESGTGRKLYININAISHYVAAGSPSSEGTLIYITSSNMLYLVTESCELITGLVQTHDRE